LFKLRITGTSLRNASFQGIELDYAVLNSCTFDDANFSGTTLHMTHFFDTSLLRADFTRAYVASADFSYSTLYKAKLTDKQLTQHLNRFSNVIFPNGTHQATVRSSINLLKNGGADDKDTNCVMDIKNATRQSISDWIHRGGNMGVRAIDYRALNNIFYNRTFTEYPLLSRCYFGNINGVRFASIEQAVSVAKYVHHSSSFINYFLLFHLSFKRVINDQRARFTLIAWLSSTAHVNLTFLDDRRFSMDEKEAVILCEYFLLILIYKYVYSN
jgi:hypothetical protein